LIHQAEPTVSASKANKTRFWLAYFFDDMPVGSTFKPGKLHITLITWFVSDKLDEEVINCFNKFSFGQKFFITVGPKQQFGPTKEVPVNLIESSEDLANLHKKSLEFFNIIEGRWAVKNPYVDRQYTPHARRRPGTRLKQGQVFKIDKIALVMAARREDGVRKVAAVSEFK
jgi:2'-5' RNA ligase